MAAGENMWDLAWGTDPAAWAGVGTLVLLIFIGEGVRDAFDPRLKV